MDDDDPQADDPAELISYLEWLLREPDPETDRRSVLGALGSAWLDLCVRDGDEAALATSLSYLNAAVSGLVDEPDHPDRYDWFYALSQAHRLRAEVADRAVEQTTSIAWLVRLLAELPDDHEDRDAAVVELAEMYSVRYLDHWIAGSPDLAALSEQLVTDVESLVLGADADDRARSAFDAMVGLARLERYQHHQRADDLELGLHRLDRGVWALPRGATLVEHMIYVLAWAHIDRAEKLGWDRTELLNAVATARRALESTEDDDDRQALDEVIACAYSVLWEQYQDRSDLDAAIESWRAVAARDGQWYAARATAELLTGRGEATENLSDVDEAIAILRHLLTVDGAGPAGDLSIALATAMRKRFALTGDRHLLDAARDQLDRVADQAVTDDERVDWMVQALLTAEAAARHDNSLPHTDVPPSVEPLASLVERGHLLLATARPIEPNQRHRLALILLIG